MQICKCCSVTFEDDEIIVDCDRETGSEYKCPHCGSDDFEDASYCVLCNEWHTEHQVESGFCLKCLYNAIDYNVAHDFMRSHDGWLSQFLISLNGEEVLYHPNAEYDNALEGVFRFKISIDYDKSFLRACREFCLPEYAHSQFGCDGAQFAKWYEHYLSNHVHSQKEVADADEYDSQLAREVFEDML